MLLHDQLRTATQGLAENPVVKVDDKGKGKGNADANRAKQPASKLLRSVDSMKRRLKDLYASLNIEGDFSALEGLPFEFVRALLQARNLKVAIRKSAIGGFFECERIDQAKRGANQTLGPSFVLSL